LFRVGLEEWLPVYRDIAEKLRIDTGRDRYATRLLSELLAGKSAKVEELEVKLLGKPVVVFGAGPSLEKHLGEEALDFLRSKCIFIAADGATTALMERGFNPDVICTDLDGRVEDQLEANRRGALLVVHAHGDNINALLNYVPLFHAPVLGSTQVEPALRVYNFGGFTDGDRCAFLAEWCGASLIAMIGMDLGRKVGKYSKPWLQASAEASQSKALKLSIAGQLLEWLASKAEAPLLLVGGTRELRGISKVSLEELASIVEG